LVPNPYNGNKVTNTGIETGMAEKSCWDQASRRQKLSLVWRNRKKISQIIKDYFYLQFFLFIILWVGQTRILYMSVDRQTDGLNKTNHLGKCPEESTMF
jgi:hypothetical protein